MRRNLSGVRVLVIEDDPELGWMTRTILEDEGAMVRVANSGGDALDTISSFDPQLAVVDARLPDMTGGTLSELLRERVESCVQVLVSGDLAEVDRWARIGAYALSKPYDVDELICMLAEAAREPAAA